jgi:hypothetical protein
MLYDEWVKGASRVSTLSWEYVCDRQRFFAHAFSLLLHWTALTFFASVSVGVEDIKGESCKSLFGVCS